jgi:undecaprenyl-diphosphatase
MDLSSTDFHLFQFINHLAVMLPFLNPVMRLLSEYGEYLFYLGVIVYWFTRNKHNRNMVAQALLSALVAFGLGGIISAMYYRDRPFVHHDVIQLIQHPSNASFPSDHALGAFVIATSIWLFRKKEGVVWLVLAALIAFSRVWTGYAHTYDYRLCGSGWVQREQ